ncbi:hypothetical protein CVT26_014298, partial [Gymnopilus dilepis]
RQRNEIIKNATSTLHLKWSAIPFTSLKLTWRRIHSSDSGKSEDCTTSVVGCDEWHLPARDGKSNIGRPYLLEHPLVTVLLKMHIVNGTSGCIPLMKKRRDLLSSIGMSFKGKFCLWVFQSLATRTQSTRQFVKALSSSGRSGSCAKVSISGRKPGLICSHALKDDSTPDPGSTTHEPTIWKSVIHLKREA